MLSGFTSQGRAYHSLDRLVALFLQEEELAFDDPVAVGLAIFYHDAVYGDSSRAMLNIPADASNEEQSAQLAERQLAGLGFHQATVARVAELIRLTETHQADPTDHDAALFLDMDMSILGTPAPIYERYAAQVRQEYAQYDAQDFCAGRLAFLTATLAAGKRVFLTDLYEGRCGAQAIINMETEKRHIEATGTPYGIKASPPADQPPPPSSLTPAETPHGTGGINIRNNRVQARPPRLPG